MAKLFATESLPAGVRRLPDMLGARRAAAFREPGAAADGWIDYTPATAR